MLWKWLVILEGLPDMNDEHLVVAKAAGWTFSGRGLDLLNKAFQPKGRDGRLPICWLDGSR